MNGRYAERKTKSPAPESPMPGMTRFGVSIPSALLQSFDDLIRGKGYRNRSEAIRDLIRDNLVKREWQSAKKTVGVITIVYSHHTRELSRALTHLQHTYYKRIISTTHIHLDPHNCLEVLVVKGKGKDLKSMGERLIGIKGVKYGNLSLNTTGRDLA